MLALNYFLELVHYDGSELRHGPPFKLRLHLKVYHGVVHKREEPVREGQAGEDQLQLPHHPGDLHEQVSRLAEHQVGIDGQVEATIVLQVYLKAQLLGRALLVADHRPDELHGLEDRQDIAEGHLPEAEPLQHLPCHLGLEQLLELHLDLLDDPVPDQGSVPELPEEEEEDGIEEVARLLAGGGGWRGLRLRRRLPGAGIGARGGGGRRGRGRAGSRLCGRRAAGRLRAMQVFPEAVLGRHAGVDDAAVGSVRPGRLGLPPVDEQELEQQREAATGQRREQDHVQQRHPGPSALPRARRPHRAAAIAGVAPAPRRRLTAAAARGRLIRVPPAAGRGGAERQRQPTSGAGPALLALRLAGPAGSRHGAARAAVASRRGGRVRAVVGGERRRRGARRGHPRP